MHISANMIQTAEADVYLDENFDMYKSRKFGGMYFTKDAAVVGCLIEMVTHRREQEELFSIISNEIRSEYYKLKERSLSK